MSPKDRADQAEQRSPLRLPNKISDASPTITSQLRCSIKEEIEEHRQDDTLTRFFLQMATFTSLLPPHWESYPSDLKMFLEKEMFDPVLGHILQSEGLMNWCPSVRKVYPLITPGDGNCLLHAASLAMWGIEDDELVLRTALFRLLRDDRNERNHMRWQRERMRADAGIPGSGLMYNTTEWDSEWDLIKELASPKRRPMTAHGLPYESLEQFHVFMLANMLRRPIIVVAQDMMRSQWGHSIQPQDVQGIYLPLNWDPAVCCRYPILLGFHQNHFTPLLCTAKLDSEDDLDNYLFPIVQQDYTPMKVHFLEEEEEKFVDSLLQKYLIIEEITHIGKSLSRAQELPGARLVSQNSHPDLDLMIPYLALAETHYRHYLEGEYGNTVESTPAIEARGKADVALGKDPQKLQSLQEQPRSFPSYSIPTGPQPGKTSWSGQGAPVGQPSDATHNAGFVASKNLPYKREFSLVEQSCKTEGCVYYRSVSTGEYCHECSQKQSQGNKCQGEGCLNPAEQGCQGLCRVCFDQKKLTEDPMVNATAPSLSKMSLDPNVNVGPSKRDVDSRYWYGKGDDGQNPGSNIPTEQGQMPPHLGVSSTGSAGLAVRRKEPVLEKAGPTQGLAKSPDNELNSMIVHQKLPTKKCIMPECPLTGEPTKNDMCSKCYAENLQVEQEIEKSKMHRQPATVEPPAYSALATAACAASSSASALPQASAAAAASGKLLYPEKKPTFTVQKSICATAGCSGIRLDKPPYNGYCISCYNQNNNIPNQATTAEVRNLGISKNQVNPNLIQNGRSQDQFRPTGPRGIDKYYSTAPQAKQAERRSGEAHQPLIYQAAAKVETTTESPAPQCAGRRCNNLAAPPKFILCEECIPIAELYKQEGTGGSVDKEAVRSAALEPQPAELNQPNDAAKQVAEPPGSTPSLLSKTAAGFKNIRVQRVKCQVPGGCADDMYGDPALNNLCSRCSAKMLMRRTRTRASPPLNQAEPRPTQSPVHQYHTAPLSPSPRIGQVPPRAQTEFLYAGPERGQRELGIQKRHTLPANFQKCAQPKCPNQANLQILDGLCNTCHRVYRNQGYAPEPLPINPDPLVGNRGRYAQPMVPEAQFYPPGYSSREEKILNIESGPRIPPRPERNRTDMGCLSEGCTNYGNPRCQGYCNSCFRLLKN
ncbi:tumor necrosis factor alpha-induced protein 3-like [Patiria miniata]|uniref:ubiquitinyl hydrolase 1 n=1 Tax=Patiria miniata TaxID=46514 RepID=A0A914BKR8_PATMI|nr:tumor necrosis factor alpha-induced protein 3-like [Patiria miniata]XP_038076520.1 tumor necrosis factor alpha-induced protein 3-like [Patiria miniata]XP_038076521.1 tumor necrosis factor alpha-induced protein 3-like [Patiria miniata]XP_038076522.1 tumor necrosis factor alpha-induced protein 3-like [Patiria miniata]XP_038076523.1 tumor necrosis factor alpha-induced protein 3-like [Patiria miniata]